MVFLSLKENKFASHSLSPPPHLDWTLFILRQKGGATQHVIIFNGLPNYFCEISTSLPQLDLLHCLEITNVITLEST